MITDALLAMLETVLSGFLSLFPNGDPLFTAEQIGNLLGSLDDLNYFLPIAETFAVVLAVMALFPIFLGVTLSLWVVAQMRGSSSRG